MRSSGALTLTVGQNNVICFRLSNKTAGRDCLERLSNIEQTELENLHSIRPDPNIGTIHNRLRGVNRSSLGAGLLAQDLPKISNKPATNSGSLGVLWYSPEPK